MNTFIQPFFDCLWEEPKLVVDILRHCDIKDIKEHLANLFINNFYKNILSNNYVENNLMFVLTSLIKDEIENLNNIDECDNFMCDDSKVGYFMNELRKNDDIKCFFKTSILNIIFDIELISNLNLNLDDQDIIDNLKVKTEKEYQSKLDDLENIINKYISVQETTEIKHELFTHKNWKEIIKQKNIAQFNSKYLKILPLSELEKIKATFGKNNPEMNDYLNDVIKNAEDDNYYSNSQLMEQFQNNKMFSSKLISLYTNKFFIIKNFLDKFISSLEQNLDILPYYIKCICKIISVLIQKKFSDISIVQKGIFIFKFFYKKLIMPILINPEIELLINNFIISGFTLPNLNIINHILNKLFSFKLFTNYCSINDNIYTPFNWYILDKMPKIFEIFNKLLDIELPPFINDFINDKLDPDFSYDYFSLNKDESIMHKIICFTKQDFNSILDGFSKLKEKVDINIYKNGNKILKAYENIIFVNKRQKISSIETFVIIKELDNENKNEQNELYEYNYENYYLLQSLNICEEHKEIFDLNLDSKINFSLKEAKSENNTKNIIIKFKNFLSDLLYRIGPLKFSDFSQFKISNTIEILNSIKKYVKLSYNVVDESIPPEWYAMTLLYLIKDIPEEYSKNDFGKLFDELEEEINISIDKYNIDFLLECYDKIKYIEKYKKNVENYFEILKDLELNEKIKQIIANDYIPVKFVLNYSNRNYSFDIIKSKSTKDELIKKQNKEKNNNLKKYKKHCHSIESFIKYFPNILIYQGNNDNNNINIDTFQIQKNFNIPEKLKQYFFSIIHEHLIINKKIENEKHLSIIENRIYDHVMRKINSKIFPQDYEDDDKLFKNELKLSWIKPEHFLEGKNDYIIDIFLPDIIKFFDSFEIDRSPRKKIENINNMFQIILQVVEFNRGKKNIGVDDQLPVLSYYFIKAKMNKFLSNLKFVQLYRNSLNEKGNEIQLVQLFAICNLIMNIKYENLIGVTKEEFDKNCNKAINPN